jgi:hypothetical protein
MLHRIIAAIQQARQLFTGYIFDLVIGLTYRVLAESKMRSSSLG